VGAGQVIKGWDQGLVGAKAGGKRQLTIPAHLGYGDKGAGDDIPPKATLVFDIEVKQIQSVKIQVLKAGKGAQAMGGDTVSVHYTGTFTNGKKFDSSRDSGNPMEIVLGQPGLVPGFTMGILGMKLGEKRKVTMPPALAYGARGAGDVIPPNSTLIFELELMKVTKKK
jgi:FKBP-type peptidyl-prolyl cis-trans isomerase